MVNVSLNVHVYYSFRFSLIIIFMSHPELVEQKCQNRECRGQSLLPGRGVRRDLANWTRKNSFCSLLVPPQAAREERERSRGHPCNPVKGLAALCNPA